MATKIRRWYVFNGAWGGEQSHTNYYYLATYPNLCDVTAYTICAVLGVYSIYDPSDFPPTTFFVTNPQSFNQDQALFSYIIAATGSTTYVPSGTNQKPYVYKRF